MSAQEYRDGRAERIDQHEHSMTARLEGHLDRSEERFAGAVAKTSDAIGAVGRFARQHAPESVGRHVADLTDRAQAALDRD